MKQTSFSDKTRACLIGGIIGDAIGTPSESLDYTAIEEKFGWIDDFSGDGTDDTVMKRLLCEALIRTGGYAGADEWAQVWLEDWNAIFGSKFAKFFISVIASARKLHYGVLPRMAALGNLPSSSSAMCISPVGIVNACNPGAAARQAYRVASLIHTYDAAFCTDGAAAMAAAVAAAFVPGATVDSILDAARRHLDPLSGKEMLDRIERIQGLASRASDFRAFRASVYDIRKEFFLPITCDSRETIPFALGILKVSGGDFERSVVYSANFGRDSDTIGTMVGAVTAALGGMKSIKKDWLAKIEGVTSFNHDYYTEKLVETAVAKLKRERELMKAFEEITA